MTNYTVRNPFFQFIKWERVGQNFFNPNINRRVFRLELIERFLSLQHGNGKKCLSISLPLSLPGWTFHRHWKKKIELGYYFPNFVCLKHDLLSRFCRILLHNYGGNRLFYESETRLPGRDIGRRCRDQIDAWPEWRGEIKSTGRAWLVNECGHGTVVGLVTRFCPMVVCCC